MKIPRCMSTQHPDNATVPFFASDSLLEGEDEIQEAYYAFSHLGCEEQMWDCEGKEVDNFVVKKLLTKHDYFFRETKLGEDVFLTVRVPNPTVEKAEAKILLETLESISRSFDTARIFYQEDIAPVFEVILPMTTSYKALNRVYYYYKNFVAGKRDKSFFEGDITISEWIGEFKPDEINVIPLVEDRDGMLDAHTMVEKYLEDKEVEYQRVFLARSDPAMNYGVVSATLLNKIALQRLYALGERLSTEILPIIGVGSAPFRGNLKPMTIDNLLAGYPSVQTFTIQSAFKYDYPEREVSKAVGELKKKKRKKPVSVDEERCLDIIGRFSTEYTKQIQELEPIINNVARHVPSRRKRKLHIGLFGYSRSVGGISLPRVIRFCASLYSIGLPPEILGMNVLDEKDIDYLKDSSTFEYDLKSAMPYFNEEVLGFIPSSLGKRLNTDIVDYEVDPRHKEVTSKILNRLRKGNSENLCEDIVEAAWIRKFLG